ncbi:MAG: class D sortase [Alkaliphilus sp.]|nr:class D sortase [Alkaliphilus sp.]
MKKNIPIMLIIIGLIIGLYPLGDRLYTWYWQNKAMEAYNQLDAIFVEEQLENPTELGRAQEEPQSQQQEQEEPQSQQEEQEEEPPKSVVQEKKIQPIGIIKINNIKVNLPIFEGATQKNMKVGVGWMKETSGIGEVGNTALAAHRSHTFGRFFNRLDEVGLGDEIIIISNGEEYKYKVFNKVVVEPTDLSVLQRNNKDRIVTLITCTPIKTATHRLIIQGKIEE